MYLDKAYIWNFVPKGTKFKGSGKLGLRVCNFPMASSKGKGLKFSIAPSRVPNFFNGDLGPSCYQNDDL